MGRAAPIVPFQVELDLQAPRASLQTCGESRHGTF